MFHSLWQFFKAILPWVIFGLFDLLGQNFNLPVLRDFSTLELAYLIFFTILVGSFLAFHNVLSKLIECRNDLDRREEIDATLTALADLRESGVAYRHEGPTRSTQVQRDEWKLKIGEWRKKVGVELSRLSRAELGLFNTLDQFQAPDYAHVKDSEIRHEMQMLFAETHRIQAAIIRWMGYLA